MSRKRKPFKAKKMWALMEVWQKRGVCLFYSTERAGRRAANVFDQPLPLIPVSVREITKKRGKK